MTEDGTVYKVLDVNITEADEAYARRQDKWACAIVRSIQRAMPAATRVTADKESIRLSDEISGYRYEFETPAEVRNKIIKRFDQGKPITLRHFQLTEAVARWPITHRTPAERAEIRARQTPTQRQPKRNKTINRNVSTYGRFVDQAELQEAITQDGNA